MKDSTPIPVSTCHKQIDLVWGINTWKDSKNCPSHICHRCGRNIRHAEAGSRTFHRKNKHPSIDWESLPHTRTGHCVVCANFCRQRAKGTVTWPSTPKLKPTSTSPAPPQAPMSFSCEAENLFEHLPTQDLPAINPLLSLSISDRSEAEASLFICIFCLCFLSNPVATPCSHNFCSTCLSAYFKFHQSDFVHCPICFHIVQFSEIKPSPNSIIIPIPHLSVCCTLCNTKGTLANFINHQCQKQKIIHCKSSCTCNNRQCSNSNLATNHQDHQEQLHVQLKDAAGLLQNLAKTHQPGQPIPPHIERMADRWMHRKIQAAKSETTLIRTGGQVS